MLILKKKTSMKNFLCTTGPTYSTLTNLKPVPLSIGLEHFFAIQNAIIDSWNSSERQDTNKKSTVARRYKLSVL